MPSDNTSTRRAVLKRLTASTAIVGGFAGSANADHWADYCDTNDLPVPDDTDFTVHIWRSPDAGEHIKDLTSLDKITAYLDKEYSKIDPFDVDFVDEGEVEPKTLRDASDADPTDPMWPFGNWVRNKFYDGRWYGEQGRIDLFYYDDDNWSGTDPGSNGSVPASGGAYNGAHPNWYRNPSPIGILRAENADEVGLKCRAKHELCHLFMPNGPDEDGFAQNDHRVMDLDEDEVEIQCLPLNETSVEFIETAYESGTVYRKAPFEVYDCIATLER